MPIAHDAVPCTAVMVTTLPREARTTMARKRRLKKLEKKVSGLAKSVSRLERETRPAAPRVVGGPAKRAASVKRTDTRKAPLAKRTTGRHSTTTRKSTAKRAPTARKSAGTRARRSGSGALRGLPS
jgi:hypothetical protein